MNQYERIALKALYKCTGKTMDLERLKGSDKKTARVRRSLIYILTQRDPGTTHSSWTDLKNLLCQHFAIGPLSEAAKKEWLARAHRLHNGRKGCQKPAMTVVRP